MQEFELKCPEHEDEFVRYVCCNPNEELQKRILCEKCVSLNRSGNMNGLKLLKNAFNDMKNKNAKYGNFKQFQENCTKEINRIQSKLIGIFESRSYLSIQNEPSLKLSDLQKAIHSFYQNQSLKDEEVIIPELIKWSIEASKCFLSISEGIKIKQRQIQMGPIDWNGNNLKFKLLDMVEKIQKYHLMDTNYEDKEILVDFGQTMKIFELQDNKLIIKNVLENQAQFTKTCFLKAKNESKIFIGFSNGNFEVWEKNLDGKYKVSHQIKAHKSTLNCMVLGQNNDILITGDDENNISCWKYKNDQMKWVFAQSLEYHTQKINSICFNQDESLLATCSNDKTFCIWQLDQNLYWKLAYKKDEDKKVNTVCFMNDDALIIQKSDYRQLFIYKFIRYQDKIELISKNSQVKSNYSYTNLTVKIQPRFYKEVGLIILESDLEQVLIKQTENFEYKTINLQYEKMKMIRLFNFGQNIVYLEKNSDYLTLKVVKIEIE